VCLVRVHLAEDLLGVESNGVGPQHPADPVLVAWEVESRDPLSTVHTPAWLVRQSSNLLFGPKGSFYPCLLSFLLNEYLSGGFSTKNIYDLTGDVT